MKIIHLPFLLLLLWQTSAIAKEIDLSLPADHHSIDTIDIDVQAVHVDEGRVLLLSGGNNYVIEVPFKEFGKDQEASFGTHTDAKRLNLPDIGTASNWKGMARISDTLLLFDGSQQNVAQFAAKDLTLVQTRTLPWDQILPADDSRGAPPKFEIEALRSKFRKAQQGAGSLMTLSGIAHDRDGWMRNKNSQVIFASTQLPGFPLVAIKCREDDISACVIDRQCRLDKTPWANSSLTGVALSTVRKQIVFADEKEHALHIFKWHSCFSSTYVKTLYLDPKIKKLSSVHIDEKDRLWITTRRADDYLNASVYVWETW